MIFPFSLIFGGNTDFVNHNESDICLVGDLKALKSIERWWKNRNEINLDTKAD